jgi:hypothetical protein
MTTLHTTFLLISFFYYYFFFFLSPSSSFYSPGFSLATLDSTAPILLATFATPMVSAAVVLPVPPDSAMALAFGFSVPVRRSSLPLIRQE